MLVRRPWYFGPVVGAVAGLVILGVGSRIAMRQIALQSGAPGGFTVEGTITVLFMGVVSGVAGGVIRGLTTVGGRLSGLTAFAVFGIACVLIALRGLNPLDANRIYLFMPLIALYVLAVEAAWRRLPWMRRLDTPVSSNEPNLSGA